MPTHTPPSYLYAEHEGAVAMVHAMLATAYDDARLLSVGGPAEAVKAVLAGLLQGGRVTLFRKTGVPDPRQSGRGYAGALQKDRTPYHLLTRRLPCGYAHGLIYPDTSLAETKHGFTLLLPKARAAEAPAALLRMVDARTTIPLHPSWADSLWHFLDKQAALTPLVGTENWVGWDVHCPESDLLRAIPEAIQRGALRVP